MKNGDVYKTNNFGHLRVINYINYRNVIVEFVETKYSTRVYAINVIKGRVKDLMSPSIHGVGYIGIGEYTSRSRAYGTWDNMLIRCYAKELAVRYPTYKDCSVQVEWHNYQNFAEWYKKNYVEGYDLDKDLLVVGNKIYSADTCIFLPPNMNCFTVNPVKSRGDYPTGVHYNRRLKKYIAQCSNGNGTKKHLGCFTTPQQASSVWVDYKLQLADKMKAEMDGIDERIYPNVVTIINNSNNGDTND